MAKSRETANSELLERIQKLSPKRLALLAGELERRLASLSAANPDPTPEPIAIVGMACRLPGGTNSPEALWDLLVDSRDAIEEVPAARWDADAYYDPTPGAPGKANTKWGGFVDNIDQFDPAFFGIAPREAVAMDPQQRILLEVAWEALERAGEATESLNGSLTGVFMGISTHDYAILCERQPDDQLGVYSGSGVSHAVAGGRLSYFLGLKGPNVALDTACSSSSVAIHLACQSLRQEECRMALAGGVNAILTPYVGIALSMAGMLAGDGRCKTFDQSANGFVRSEGCGVLVLKRLSDAIADGNRVLGLIRGSAINHDGRSSGLAAPNGPSQEAVIATALRQAGVAPADVDYIEAHGTGTVLGDAIELGALGAAFASRPSEEPPLRLGSVKTNLGHTESAAGVTGVMKVLLALQHEQLPAHLHLSPETRNPALSSLPFEVPGSLSAWPAGSRPRIAGTSSFGFSGTNAHIVLQEAPPAPEVAGIPVEAEIVTLSAKTLEALESLCALHHAYLAAHPKTSLADLAFTLNAGRSHFQHRLALLVRSTEQLTSRLAEIAGNGIAASPAYRFISSFDQPPIAFLFSGQGSQYPAMGAELYRHSSVFRACLDHCDDLVAGILPHRLSDIIRGAADAPADLIHETAWTQPALLAFEYSLAMLWRSWGVTPSAVLGHSIGEITAACLAEVLSIDAALKLACERGRLMASMPGGKMLAVRLNEAEAQELMRPFDRLSLAAVNGARSIVISGDPEQIDSLRSALSDRGIVSQPLTVSHAFHSAMMDPILAEFETHVSSLTLSEPALPIVSNVTGTFSTPGQLTHPAYWRDHLRGAVRFADGLTALATQRPALMLEIGPDATLARLSKSVLSAQPIPSLASQSRTVDSTTSLYEALVALYLAGKSIDWKAVYPDRHARKLVLPTYPFQRQRYWLDIAPDLALEKTAKRAEPKPLSRPQLYAAQWQPHTAPETSSHASALPAILLLESAETSPLSSHLQSSGASYDRLEIIRSTTAPPDSELAAAVQAWLKQHRELSLVVLHIPASEESDTLPATVEENAATILSVLQAVAMGDALPSELLFVTRASAVVTGDNKPDLAGSAADALLKTARLEYPLLKSRWIDLPSKPTAADLDLFTATLSSPGMENSLAIRNGRIFVPRVHAVLPTAPTPPAFRKDAAYLVTGAYGALGFNTVEWLARSGACCIALMGRRKPSPEILARMKLLEQNGVELVACTGDLARRHDLELVFHRIAETGHPLRGIIHSAGVVEDATLLQQDRAVLQRVFASKVQGAWNLHQMAVSHSLDFFVLYGSAASTLGSPGQANYAAANGFLDSLSLYRTSLGLPSLTIAWGPWSEIGMATHVKDTGRGSRAGITPTSPAQGNQLLELALAAAVPSVSALDMDWQAYRQIHPAPSALAFLEDLSASLPRREDAVPVEPLFAGVLQQLLETTNPAARRQLIDQYLSTCIRAALGLAAAPVLPQDQPFAHLGLDSLMALELKNQIQRDISLSLPSNFFFEYPNLQLASQAVDSLLAGSRSSHATSSVEFEEFVL